MHNVCFDLGDNQILVIGCAYILELSPNWEAMKAENRKNDIKI